MFNCREGVVLFVVVVFLNAKIRQKLFEHSFDFCTIKKITTKQSVILI